MPDSHTRVSRNALLSSLPPETLDIVLSFLGPISLVQLHCATAASLETISRRISTVKCARHWLILSKRLPLPARNRSNETLDATKETSLRHRRKQIQANEAASRLTNWQPCSKHALLRILRDQVQHINDIASILHHCTASAHLSWFFELRALGLDDGRRQDSYMEIPMRRLLDSIQAAFLIGYSKFLNFDHDKDNVNNVWKEFIALHDGDVQYDLEFSDQLMFMCALYRLQQLPPQAVLARFHGILVRCSRFHLLLLSRVLQTGRSDSFRRKYQASHRETPSNDVLTAFGQNEPDVQDVVSSLTQAQRCSMMSCVQEMVDSFVAGNTVSVSRSC